MPRGNVRRRGVLLICFAVLLSPHVKTRPASPRTSGVISEGTVEQMTCICSPNHCEDTGSNSNDCSRKCQENCDSTLARRLLLRRCKDLNLLRSLPE